MAHKDIDREFQRILDYVPDAIMITDLEGVILDCNTATLELLGCALKEEVKNRAIFEFIPAYERERAEGDLAQTRQQGTIKNAEYPVCRKDGTEFSAEISAGVITDAHGVPAGLIVISKDVTERKKTAEALREREASLRSIFRAAPTGIGVVSNRILLRVNDRLCEMLGYAPEELIGKNARLIYPSDEEFEWVGREKYQQISETGMGTVETRWVRKDGSIIDVLLSSAPFSPETMTSEVTFVALDITERKRSEAELNKTKALLMAAIEQTPAGIVIADAPDVTIRIANSAALGIRGGMAELLTQIPVELHSERWQIFRPDGTPFPPEELPLSQAILDGTTAQNVEAIMRRADGADRWVLVNAGPVRDANGTIIAGVAVFPDVTESKLAERALRESETLFRSIFEQSGEAIFFADSDGQLLEVNARICELLGYSREELLGMNLQDAIHPDDLVAAPIRFAELAVGRSLLTERRVVRKDGAILLFEVNSRMLDNGKIFGNARDITFRREYENQLRMQARLLDAVQQTVVAVDAAGIIIYWNECSERLFGWSRADVLGKGLSSILDIENLEMYRAQIGPLLLQGKSWTGEMQAKNKSGRSFPVLATASPLFYDDVFSGSIIVSFDITERKLAEEELKVYRTFAETAGQGFGFADMHGVITYANSALLRLVGLDKEEEMVGTNVAMYYPRAIAKDLVTRIFPRVSREGQWIGELPLKSVKGMVTPTIQNIFVIRGPGGTPTHFGNVLTNIAEQKRAEEALREGEERFRRIFEESPLGMVTAGPDFRFLRANASFCRMMGYSEAELLVRTFKDITHPEHITPDGESVLKLIKGEIPLYRTEKRYVRKDKGIIWANTIVNIVRDKDGEFLYCLAMVEDITERKQAADRLRQATEKLKTEHGALREKNIALKEFLEHMNQGKEDFKHEISSSVYNLLYPVVKELRKTGGHLAIRQIDQLENNIKSIVKKDVDEFKLNYDRLTSREMEICELIRKGMSSKEIAETLNIARETVHKHRESIRRKLQLRGKGINLPAFLKSRPR